MTEDVNTEGNADARTSEENSTSDIAEKMFDAKEGGDAGKSGNDKESEGKSDITGEAKAGESKEGEKTGEDKGAKKGDESKKGEEKKTVYDDIEMPKLPEGMEVDQELFSGIKEIAAKHNLPKEAVQELVNAYSKRIAESDNTLKNQWNKIEQGWITDAKSDKEIGGEKFDQTVTKAIKAIDRFGTPALKTTLNDTGFGNHPEMIRMMAKIGEKISEGGAFVKGNNAQQKTASEIMYDKS